ncbi:MULTISPECIES: hypothetical protein [unclassified Duganella]|uniref:hypothetical protein n=1 Tax=unclassified Duganella TaxID=2636909 RepID=UPI000E35615E|nr:MULTISPECIES: hypothetical protein [unclassified Duganella]RFP08599.1 hypothetical protein D0T23_28180 [Duganella sp. BJB475]RFP27547.1 hypothetical protein D0T21_22575 [Duganella sp. BJB476]
MNFTRSQKTSPKVPPAAYDELCDFLRQSGSPLTPAEAIAGAIKLWIEKNREDAAPLRGYQWKQLFLPEATRLRLHSGDNWHGAEVVGDDLIFRGAAVSPNQMVQQVCGDARNAWLELWVRFPGEKNWTKAAQLRACQNELAAKAPLSPADAMAAAAKAMSAALSTALTLVEHANHQSQNTLERRLPRYRRTHDQLDDIH